MMYEDVVCGHVDSRELIISETEFRRRMGGTGSLEDEISVNCRKKLDEAMNCRFAYTVTGLKFPEPGVCDFGFAEIRSNNLYKNLKGCTNAFIFAVTIGTGVDRLLMRLGITSPGEHFITDAMASAAAEALCDYTEEIIRNNFRDGSDEIRKTGYDIKEAGSEIIWRPRYSPGYGDCGIENQKIVMDCLRGEKTLGIVLNESCFMTPSKSITAIMGMNYEKK